MAQPYNMVSLSLITNFFKYSLNRGIIISPCLFFCITSHAQNLIQNPSFEQYNQCPQPNNCDIGSIPFWQWSKSAIAYANLCNFSDTLAVSCAAPFNVAAGGCFEYPQDGDGYALVDVIAGDGMLTYRNHLQSKLLKPLQSAKCYYFSMYINLCDSCGFATDDIGVLFVNNFINVNGPNLVENFPPPQIMHLGEYITNKENWIKYDGFFTATGGENFILIGSMSPPANISEINLPTGNDWNHKATYWVDNLSLIECDSLTGIEEHTIENNVEVYPNPASDILNVKFERPLKQPSILTVYDLTGKLINSYTLTTISNLVSLFSYSNGLYIYHILQNGSAIQHGKFIVSN